VVVSPRAGRIVRSHHVGLRVRSRGLSGVLWARLNGVQIADDFGRPRRGVRAVRVSVSHGLRRGRNVLRVRVRRRGQVPARATVRFFVRTKRPLVGAGRHGRIVIGSRTRLYGQVKHAKSRGVRRAARSKVRWKLVRAPRRSGIRATGAGGGRPLSKLTSPAGLTAGLPAGAGLLHIAAHPRRREVRDKGPRDTRRRAAQAVGARRHDDRHPSGREAGDPRGDATYLLRDAVRRGNGSDTYVQVLALERKTLAPVLDENRRVWNRMYTSVSALGDDLRGLDDTKLVILVLQPSDYGRRLEPRCVRPRR
jgi:hypothetical protein